MTAPVTELLYTYCLAIQFLVDSNDSTCWLNGELVALVSTDDRVEDGSIWFAVSVLCDDLQAVKTESSLVLVWENPGIWTL